MAWNPKLFHEFCEYFLFAPDSFISAKALFHARSVGTWKQYLPIAKRLWSQANIVGVFLFPITTSKLQRVLQSIPQGKWTALHWTKVRMYLKIVAELNNVVIDRRILLIIEGNARQNVITMQPRPPRPIVTPAQFRVMLFRIKSLRKSFHQQRSLMAALIGFYATGRAFDVSKLQGKHLEFGEDCIKINWHIRKNNRLALKRHVAIIYSNFSWLCPVLNILKCLAYLRVGREDFLFHKEGNKSEPMIPSSIVASFKSVQKAARSFPVLTLTDVRASSVTALARAQNDATLIQIWGGWASNQMQSYFRQNDDLRRSLQNHLDA